MQDQILGVLQAYNRPVPVYIIVYEMGLCGVSGARTEQERDSQRAVERELRSLIASQQVETDMVKYCLPGYW